ncbi:hypothetical protein BDV38DRAFT_240696 [Aspergillus pseudotamarii]|uniref:Uncharacterized protein n=1 Tax=Aspergillus pseudotamarii TaxID=132259 RepID=A0A5N6T0N8_ASPPS|nr:uncharacterized protein BDV38DRAFT_240696 [Aspergillus pseudotamarii]KAE8139967.1 hypothetical protein BDV38DRAFT_240696 [Aspergillus pseudotamarii]
MESVRMGGLHNILRRSFRGVRFPSEIHRRQKEKSDLMASLFFSYFLFILRVFSIFLRFSFRLYSLILLFFRDTVF